MHRNMTSGKAMEGEGELQGELHGASVRKLWTEQRLWNQEDSLCYSSSTGLCNRLTA